MKARTRERRNPRPWFLDVSRHDVRLGDDRLARKNPERTLLSMADRTVIAGRIIMIMMDVNDKQCRRESENDQYARSPNTHGDPV